MRCDAMRCDAMSRDAGIEAGVMNIVGRVGWQRET